MHELISQGQYQSEWQFQLEIERTIAKARDGHLRYSGNALTPIQFKRHGRIVSVSRDGLEIPKLHLVEGGEENHVLSALPIVKISGIDAVDFLLSNNTINRVHDTHADYNSQVMEGPKNGFRVPRGYPGLDTVVEFEDGSVKVIATLALVTRSFDGITSPENFYKQFCTDRPIPRSGSEAEGLSILPSAYQSSVGDAKIGVLVIPSFARDRVAVRNTIHKALTDFRSSGVSKIIIDMQSNRGGYVSFIRSSN